MWLDNDVYFVMSRMLTLTQNLDVFGQMCRFVCDEPQSIASHIAVGLKGFDHIFNAVDFVVFGVVSSILLINWRHLFGILHKLQTLQKCKRPKVIEWFLYSVYCSHILCWDNCMGKGTYWRHNLQYVLVNVNSLACGYTLWAIKKRDTFIFLITLANIDWFS